MSDEISEFEMIYKPNINIQNVSKNIKNLLKIIKINVE